MISGRELFNLPLILVFQVGPFGDWLAFIDTTKVYSDFALYPDLFRHQSEQMSLFVRRQYSASAMRYSIKQAVDGI